MAKFQRPENALKRANEFIEVGKKNRALDTLQDLFKNRRRWTGTWTESVLEPIMYKYLSLCVELQKSHAAKEGLFQYRNMFQAVNVSSLEMVIRYYLRLAEEKTEAARKQSQQAVLDIDDLDNIATPESILLCAVSVNDAQDRRDRAILIPWVKFLWDSYCQNLDLLKINAHLETLYHEIARMAFAFCLKYVRKTEFRKLCEKLRKHLDDITKLPQVPANVSINKVETQLLMLETRLIQLDSAIQMELWHEAYKVIEDIHGLMNLSKKLKSPKTMANYYQKLVMVFWKAGNHLFHAAALFKLFQLSRDMKKNMYSEELQEMANKVLLAILSIPLPSAHPEFDRFIETDKSPNEKTQKLATLVGLLQPPSRASLLKDIVRLNVVNLASPPFQDLYNCLEVDFHPLELCSRVESVFSQLPQDKLSPLLQYIPALKDFALVRLIHQIAQVYQTIKLTRLIELAKFTDAFHLERLLVDCVRFNDMQIRINHGKQIIHFGVDLSEAQRENHPCGPVLQAMPSEQIRCQLVNLANVLHRANNIINPNTKKQEREKLRAQMVQYYHNTKLKEHKRILERQKIIEQRKEYIEHINYVREQEEERRQEEIQRQQQLAEQKRLEQEREERERKRQNSEIQQIKDRTLKEKMYQISKTSHGQKFLKKLDEDEIKKLDAEQIAAREIEELQKERKETLQKLKTQDKKVDYLVRAKRTEEIPLIIKAVEEKTEQAKQLWEQQEAERIQAAIEERKEMQATRERLARTKKEADSFLEKIMSERRSIHLEKLATFEATLEQERAKRLLERKIQRKIDRKLQWEREIAEAAERKRMEEQRAQLEEERKRMEEERAKREEEEKAKKAEEAERLAKLERQAEIRRQKELEIEKKLEEDTLKALEKDHTRRSTWRTSNEEERCFRESSWRSTQQPREHDDPRNRNGPRDRHAPRDRDGLGDRDSPSDLDVPKEPRDRDGPSNRFRDGDVSRNSDGPRWQRVGDRRRDRDRNSDRGDSNQERRWSNDHFRERNTGGSVRSMANWRVAKEQPPARDPPS
ncbi:hypothetical protein TKK_0011831 [Trichogramma kaykai]|uniref:Eukaryotic translation initiation factor 3 subunit A n=1 Tax=Trichogramma kaykai TaxID=54128 RepID=A0ABD2WQN1_9HYME